MSYGSDWRDLSTLDFSRLEGKKLLKRALERRLTTPRGSIFYAPDYGFDLSQYLQADWDSQIEMEMLTKAATELEKDRRVIEASLFVKDKTLSTLEIRVSVVARDETELTFDLLISPTEVSSV